MANVEADTYESVIAYLYLGTDYTDYHGSLVYVYTYSIREIRVIRA